MCLSYKEQLLSSGLMKGEGHTLHESKKLSMELSMGSGWANIINQIIARDSGSSYEVGTHSPIHTKNMSLNYLQSHEKHSFIIRNSTLFIFPKP